MPWKATSVMDARIEFVARALRGAASFSALCRASGVSRPTGYRWVARYHEVGCFALLGERSRRPRRSSGKTPAEVEERVVALRRELGWGGRKLRVILAQQGIDLTEPTINRIIRRYGLTDSRLSHEPATGRFARDQPNELWQMDFKGEYPLAQGYCYPLSMVDDHSRYAVGLYGLLNQRGEGVYRCLVDTFQRYGVPEAMLMDHGTPWWSTTNGHGLTWVSVAVIKQGIRVLFGRVRHPQTQGKVERFHRTLAETVRHRGQPAGVGLRQWRTWLRAFREEYNQVRPHEALGMAVPASRYRPSPRAYDPDPPEWEYPVGVKVVRLNSQGCFDYGRRRFFVCEALAGERVGITTVDDKLLVSYRQMDVREIDLWLGKTRALVLPNQHP